jgi:hypothetical protein
MTTVDYINKDWQLTDLTSSERAPHRDKTVPLKKKKKIYGQKSQTGLDTKTYWLTVSRNVTLTLWHANSLIHMDMWSMIGIHRPM